MSEQTPRGEFETAMVRACDVGKMEPDEPLRVALVGAARGNDQVAGMVKELAGMVGIVGELMDRVGKNAGERAAETAGRVLTAHRGLAIREAGKTRLLLYVAVPLLTAAAGWMGHALLPTRTEVGAMPPAMARALQATDLEEAWNRRIAQQPFQGRQWFMIPVWAEAGSPRPAQ
jgi:hypothetical protein